MFLFRSGIKIGPALVFLRQIGRQSSNLTIVSEVNGVRKIILNNPKKRNALSLAMLEKLKDDIFCDIDHVRCIVLNSTGPVFSSGHDLKELRESSREVRHAIFEKCTELMVGIQKAPVPVLAVVQGLAAAAGCQLVATCDIVIASANAQFSTPGAAVGLFCSTPGIAVSRTVPQKVASYMLLTGNNISAQEALQCGLVSKTAPQDELDIVTNQIVETILSKSRSVIELGKNFFYQQLEQDIETAYRNGSEVMVDNLGKGDAQEGISAFFEKRQPRWKHT